MVDIRFISVLAVAVLIIAGAIASLPNHGDSEFGFTEVDSILSVYGNANNDMTIDDMDLTIIMDVMMGVRNLSEHPLADVNADGVVDSLDLELCRAMVNREPGFVYVHCDDVRDEPVAVRVPYPLKNIVLQRTPPTTLACEIGIGPSVAGYFDADPAVHSAIYDTARDLGGTAMGVSDAAWHNLVELDISLESEGGIGAIVTESGTSNLEGRYGAISAAGIPLLRFPTSDVEDSCVFAVTMGFICGPDFEKASSNYATICLEAMVHIQDGLSRISEEERMVFVAIAMKRYICGTESDYTGKCELAGGRSVAELNSDFIRDYGGDRVVKMDSSEALSKFDQHLDIVFSFTSVDYSDSGYREIAGIWNDSRPYFELLDCYESMVLVNVSMPQVCQLAYMVACLYPDVIGMDYADGLLKDIMNNSGATYAFDDVISIFTYQDHLRFQGEGSG